MSKLQGQATLDDMSDSVASAKQSLAAQGPPSES